MMMMMMKKGNCFGCGCSGGLESSNGACWVRGSRLGKGAYAAVFLAKTQPSSGPEKQSNLPHLIAVKSATAEQAWSLELEKQVLLELSSSPYVVRFFGDEITETKEGEKIYNILLEYCSGLSLDHHMNKLFHHGLLESEVRLYTRDIVRGLKDIHYKGYIHCDIKPNNILLVPGTGDRSGGFVAKISDFGTVKSLLEEHEDQDLRGTCRYMSPEYVRHKKLTRPADIWALGCLVIEMLSGKPAWEYSDEKYLLHFIGYTNQVPKMPSKISEEAKDFLGKCLDRDPMSRWSADELLEHPFLCRAPQQKKA